MQKPSLYGINNSNRDFSDPYYWGKNQFNNSFPVALTCYMRDKKRNVVYLSLSKELKISQREESIDKVFNTTQKSSELYFSFESRFEPFSKFVHDDLKSIDLVIKSISDNQPIQPLEIKLTTLPDNSTSNLTEDKYGSEIVVRSPTMRYMALSLANSLESKFSEIREIFEPILHNIRSWENVYEIKNKLRSLMESLEQFFSVYRSFEKPLLLQSIWKTIGKSASLADNCLDIFVWSDFALSRLFMDAAKNSDSEKITRQQRAAVRLGRFLYEVSKNKKVYQQPIYDGMNFDTLNDKEFSISGNKTNSYMACNRLKNPAIHKNEIKKIILGGGQKYLSPERRFDAIIYFSKGLFE
ncbi:MAG: HindVP family restriction endonuclease [Calditrichia bacterium]|nr:HindVP family restriction endonuclease [Calditrichia bacterium]